MTRLEFSDPAGIGERSRLLAWSCLVVCTRFTQHIYKLYGEPWRRQAPDAQIRFLEKKLALAFRTNLTRYIHDLYL